MFTHHGLSLFSDCQCIEQNKSAATIVFVDCNDTWTLFLVHFLKQTDGNNCGPIACLKLMEMYHVITLDDIKTSQKSYRSLILDQHERMLDELHSQLFVSTRMHKHQVKESDIICMCVVPRHTSLQTTIQHCCNMTFHSQCLAHYLTTSQVCPYCKAATSTKNNPHNTPTTTINTTTTVVDGMTTTTNNPHNTPTTTINTTTSDAGEGNTTTVVDGMTATELVRTDSVQKRRMFQDRQGQKMMERHAKSLQLLGMEVQPGSVVTLYIDPRVASHARGVTAVVVDCRTDTGGIVACSSKGIIINGSSRQIWWIAADGYKLQSSPGQLFSALPPELFHVQRQVIDGIFDLSAHPKCTLGEAHQDAVGASSPCKRASCGCKNGKCSKRCGCVRNKVPCSSSCSCSGNCVINQRKHNNAPG